MCHKCEHHQDQVCECGGSRKEVSCDCGKECCGNDKQFHRCYHTKEEQIPELEKYLKDLRLEVEAVEERLSDLRK